MTYSAEFIVNVGQFEHVKFTVTASTIVDFHQQMGQLAGSNAPEFAGDTHASLKAAVLYGRDQALKALAEPSVKVPPLEPIPRAEIDPGSPVRPDDDPPIEELIVQQLDAKILDVQDKSQKPWERPVEAAPVKPWDVVAEQSAKPADDPFADF